MEDQVKEIWNKTSRVGVRRDCSDDEKKQNLKKYFNILFGGRINFPSIVVAGSKGKGSTSAAIESILRAAGLKTFFFVSPHLILPTERFLINGEKIENEKFIYLYNIIQKMLAENELEDPMMPCCSYLMAAYLVKKEKFDVAIIEVGIGGRLDWSKIFNPSISVITHLEYEHTDFLGNTAYSIAWNKFGIVTKKSKNFSVNQTRPEFTEALQKLQNESNRYLEIVQPFWKGETGLKGPTAVINTSLAIEVAKYFLINFYQSQNNKIRIDIEKSIIEGAKNANILGRFMKESINGINWMIDGAHTVDSVEICYQWFLESGEKTKDTCLLCAVSKNRNANYVLSTLLTKKWKRTIFVNSFHADPPTNQENLEVYENPGEAIKSIINDAPKTVLVTGSLFIVSEVIKNLYKK
ncbi:FolC bifunctional protein [Tritrichomonas foetus]|uniref:tetrahydrofolate synthase n=1 Tax=Tritrichomonas foetus TaxID=1144522 RepID=A0A1J4JDJ2_9EUKA|nr:FolC bifunctional protein [Tritrichomonas foetus]|eukprot:OHS97226.1 FolC bifunctional protein [Tritrichomonas foetus]